MIICDSLCAWDANCRLGTLLVSEIPGLRLVEPGSFCKSTRMQMSGNSSAGKRKRATLGEACVLYFHDLHPQEHIQDPALRSCMDRHCPVFREENAPWRMCIDYHVDLFIIFFLQGTTVDPVVHFYGNRSRVYRHDALNRLFSLLEKQRCGQPQAEACFYTRYCEHVFCKMCVGSTFFLRFIHWLRGSIVFSTRDFLRPALSEVNRATFCQWRERQRARATSHALP